MADEKPIWEGPYGGDVCMVRMSHGQVIVTCRNIRDTADDRTSVLKKAVHEIATERDTLRAENEALRAQFNPFGNAVARVAKQTLADVGQLERENAALRERLAKLEAASRDVVDLWVSSYCKCTGCFEPCDMDEPVGALEALLDGSSKDAREP